MKVELTIKKEFDVKYLEAEVGVRYWENTEVNGKPDTEGDQIPCRDGHYWKPLIDIETGQIVNWEQGKTASVHYKSCDDNTFKLREADGNIIEIKEGYVIDMMSPAEEGYGDYVIMEIDQNGFIKDFKADFSEFQVKES